MVRFHPVTPNTRRGRAADAHACKALLGWFDSTRRVQISECGLGVDRLPWEQVHAGSSPATQTNFRPKHIQMCTRLISERQWVQILRDGPSGCKSAVRRPGPEPGGRRCESCHPDQFADAHGVRSRCQRNRCRVRLPMSAPEKPRPTDGRRSSTPTMWVRILLGAPYSPCRLDRCAGSYPAACQFESDRGGQTCVRDGIGIRARSRALILWVQLPPDAPDDVRSTGVRAALIKPRNLQIRETVQFESVTDNQNIHAEGIRHRASEA